MSADYFAPFDTIRYEGPDSASDLAYRWYDKDRLVLGKRMEDHLRVAVCFWHTFCWPGSDVFGAGTFSRPWHAGANDAAAAKALADKGTVPPGVNPEHHKVRQAALLLKRDVQFKDGAKEALVAKKGVRQTSV